jgi:phosphoglycolate phosphatase-like HAD superfamily hydrolase
MIGDKDGDIEPGKRHGLKTIFCNYGHGKSNLADIIVNNPNDLIISIEKIILNGKE